MPLPNNEDALQRIHELASEERLALSQKARNEMKRLNYQHPDACDLLFEVELDECSEFKVEPSHRDPERPVVTFVTEFLSRANEESKRPADRVFVEVLLNADELYLLACKPDGSPE